MVSSKVVNTKLYSFRVENGLTQEVVAKKLGVSLVTYQHMERGESDGKPKTWLKVQNLYAIPDNDMWSIIKMSIK